MLPSLRALGCALLLLVPLTPWAADPRLTLAPASARPGDPVAVWVRGAAAAPEGTLGERPLRFVKVKGGYLAVTGLPVELAPGALEARVQVAGAPGAPARECKAQLTVEPARFPSRELKVAGRFVEPPPEVKARTEADKEAMTAAFAQPLVPPMFRANFARPRKARTTAPFGDLRTFNGKLASQHFGTDIDGKVGAPVAAANAGEVVLVRDCYASGLTVLVHHGAGLYTAYFHLSRADVRQGQRVKAGQRVGLVGATGRVTGPHLHWGAKADGLWVDAEALLGLDLTAAR